MLRYWAVLAMVLWVGGLWITGLSAYSLFQIVESKQLAGNVAGQLFTNMSYIGITASAVILLQYLVEYQAAAIKQWCFWMVILMLVLVLFGHFGIQPLLAQLKANALPNEVMQSAYASRFGMWHGIASSLYLIQCVLGLLLVWRMTKH